VLPAYERLDAAQRLLVEGVERLVEQEQLGLLDPPTQLVGELCHRRGAGGARDRVVEAVPPPAGALCLVHRAVGVAHQGVGTGAGVARRGDPDAAADRDVVAAGHDRGGDRAHDAVGDGAHVVVAQHRAERDELVAPEAGDGVAAAHERGQAACHLDEHLVAGMVAERVVDPLEVVEVDEAHRHPGRSPLERREDLLEAIEHRHPIDEPGQVVVHRQVGERLLGGDLGGDVAGDAEGADDGPTGVAKRHLGRRDPAVGTVLEGLALDLGDDRLARGDDLPLVFESLGGMLLVEEVVVRLAEHLADAAPLCLGVQPALADEEEPAVEVLEEDPFLGAGEQVLCAEADERVEVVALAQILRCLLVLAHLASLVRCLSTRLAARDLVGRPGAAVPFRIALRQARLTARLVAILSPATRAGGPLQQDVTR